MDSHENPSTLRKKQERRTYYLKNKNRYSCEGCDIKTESQFHMERHKRQKHSLGAKIKNAITQQNKGLQCTSCDYKCSESYTLKLHIQRIHEKIKVNCDQCDFTTTSSGYLSKHKKRHDAIDPYWCEHCAFRTTRKDNLDRHIKFQHEGFRFRCDNCEYTCAEARTLQLHKIKQHSDTNKELNDSKSGDTLKASGILNSVKDEIDGTSPVVSVEPGVSESASAEKKGKVHFKVRNHKGVVIIEEEGSTFVRINQLARQRRQEINSISVAIN